MASHGLIVRRTERFEISLPSKVRVGMQHLDQVQFAKGVVDEHRWMVVELVDFAEGGIGFVSDTFFARGLHLEIAVPGFGAHAGETMLRCEMQVKRVQMTDRRPSYLVGCAFVNVEEDTQSAIDRLIDLLDGEADQAAEFGDANDVDGAGDTGDIGDIDDTFGGRGDA